MMRGLWWFVLMAAMAGPAALAQASPQAAITDLGAATRHWINTVRAAEGRAPLAVSAVLSHAARAHAQDLARTGRFSHMGRDGSNVGDRVRRAGYGFCFVAENIAKGQGTPEEVLRGWMASPGHRRNLLAARATEYGLVRGAGRLWVMVLGRDGC